MRSECIDIPPVSSAASEAQREGLTPESDLSSNYLGSCHLLTVQTYLGPHKTLCVLSTRLDSRTPLTLPSIQSKLDPKLAILTPQAQ